ncbi:MAG: uncharacterized protein KVP18_002796 [Porospora cf. gigantea A]|uniref:uncharacterized protein n=1 Tax=Porospora cf. gigantea A TaxID=2853593 RepID=UPI00355A1819|nr:MAG: hypothetical protein KVP18_002796 [Porospora cf. gigantea A]
MQMPSAPGIGEKLFDAIGGFDVSEPRLLSAFKDMSRLTSATSAGPGGSRMDLSEEPHMADAHFIELSLKATLAGSGRNSLVVGLLEHLMGLSSVNVGSACRLNSDLRHIQRRVLACETRGRRYGVYENWHPGR